MSIGESAIGEFAIGEAPSAGGGGPDYTYELASAVVFSGEVDQTRAWYYYQASGMAFTTAQELSKGYHAADTLSLAEGVTHDVTSTELVAELMTIEDVGAVLYDALAAETVNVVNAEAYTQAIKVVDALLLTTAEDSRLNAIASVAEAIALTDVGGVVDVANVADTVTITEAIMANLIAFENYADIVTVAETPTWLISVYIDTAEGVQIIDATQLAQQLSLLVEEGVRFEVGLRLGTDVYAAWLVNTATTGSSRYENFPFNSFAEGPDGYYGAMEDGIYLMQGDDDDGTNIDVSIKSGLYDFGERKSKRIHDVFLGVLTSGSLVLKVTADEQGVRTESWYEVVHHGDADNHRAKVGKGLRGVYWGWELVNVDGADLDLNNIQMYPLTLSRRV